MRLQAALAQSPVGETAPTVLDAKYCEDVYRTIRRKTRTVTVRMQPPSGGAACAKWSQPRELRGQMGRDQRSQLVSGGISEC